VASLPVAHSRRFAFDEPPSRMICPKCGYNLRHGLTHQRCSPLFAVLRRYIPGAARLPGAARCFTGNCAEFPAVTGPQVRHSGSPATALAALRVGGAQVEWIPSSDKKKNMCHGQNIQNMVYFPMLGDGQSIHRIQYTYCKEFLMIGRWPELIYHAFDAGISKTSVKGISATLFFRQTTDYLLRHLSRGIFDEGTCPKTHHPLILGDGMTQELY